MEVKSCEPHFVRIYIAGDVTQHRQSCRGFCFAEGLCVTVTPTSYIYTGGEEGGSIIELINYARFPVKNKHLWNIAEKLAKKIMKESFQSSFSLFSETRSEFHSRRGKK